MLTYENQLVANANIASVYRYVNSKIRSRSAVGQLSDKTGDLVTNSLGKANILQQTFIKHLTIDDGVLPKAADRIQSPTVSKQPQSHLIRSGLNTPCDQTTRA